MMSEYRETTTFIPNSMPQIMAEYIWLDGHTPSQELRSKTKVLDGPITTIDQIPEWGFDGSSTEQASGHFSDCLLKPVRFIKDPLRGGDHILVLCEVRNPDGSVHESNARARLVEMTTRYAAHEPWFGIEQEYTFFAEGRPLGWPENGYPAPQGRYYCGVGADRMFGRTIVNEHLAACLAMGLCIYGINAEVMPGQWEFQVGTGDTLLVADHLWIGRWLLQRIAEDHGVDVRFDPKPVEGDWNGAGAHTNFSTKAMRELGGIDVVKAACEKLKVRHTDHIAVYGVGNERRLTGKHETCPITEFRYGVSDRGASIRIPMATANSGSGYLEDRRPAANCDPYLVFARLLETICT